MRHRASLRCKRDRGRRSGFRAGGFRRQWLIRRGRWLLPPKPSINAWLPEASDQNRDSDENGDPEAATIDPSGPRVDWLSM